MKKIGGTQRNSSLQALYDSFNKSKALQLLHCLLSATKHHFFFCFSLKKRIAKENLTKNSKCFIACSLFIDDSKLNKAVSKHLGLDSENDNNQTKVTVCPYEGISDAVKEAANSGARIWVWKRAFDFVKHFSRVNFDHMFQLRLSEIFQG